MEKKTTRKVKKSYIKHFFHFSRSIYLFFKESAAIGWPVVKFPGQWV